MILTKVRSVEFDETSQMGVVMLQDAEGKKVLPIWVGIFEAQATLFRLKNISSPRPLTHDLLRNVIENLKGKVEYVFVDDIVGNTYYAKINVVLGNEKIVIDSRPSDAIALALRTDSPIYVSEKVFDSHSLDTDKFEDEQRQEFFKQYLANLSEDDLNKA